MKESKIYTIILTGGEGTRLRPFTQDRSKPLVPVLNNFPILELMLYSLAYGAGLRDFIFGVKGTKHYINLQNYFQGGSGWSGKLQITPQAHFEYQNPNYCDTGLADSIRYNINEFNLDSPIIVSPADILYWGIDIKKLYKKALQSPYPLTIGLTKVRDASQMGVVELDKTIGKIVSFVEKPGPGYKQESLASTGIYIMKPEMFPLLTADLGNVVIPNLVKAGKVGGFVFEHPWYDFGNPQEHLKSVLTLLQHPTPCMENFLTRVCTEYPTSNGRIWIRGKSSFSLERSKEIIEKIKSGRISTRGSVFIGKDSEIEDGVHLNNCSIGDLSFVGEGSEITESNILDAWQIGKDCKVTKSFLGRGGNISNRCVVDSQFLSDSTVIK